MIEEFSWNTAGIYTRTNLFNIFINGSLCFIKETDICNFAGNATFCVCVCVCVFVCVCVCVYVWKNLDSIVTNALITWLKNNEMVVANLSTFQLMFHSKQKSMKNMIFVGKTIKLSETSEHLGIAMDKNINFKWRIENICGKANIKKKALCRIRKFLDLEQAQILTKKYILSTFRYCPLICNE